MSNPLTETANQAINRISKMLDDRDREYQELQDRYVNLKVSHKKDRELLKEALWHLEDLLYMDDNEQQQADTIINTIKAHLGAKDYE